MFARHLRLPPSPMQNPSVVAERMFTLKYRENALPYARFGFIVSKRVHPRAAVRNKVKRRFRSCVEELSPRISSGVDFLFILRPHAQAAEKIEICAIIASVLQKHALLK